MSVPLKQGILKSLNSVPSKEEEEEEEAPSYDFLLGSFDSALGARPGTSPNRAPFKGLHLLRVVLHLLPFSLLGVRLCALLLVPETLGSPFSDPLNVEYFVWLLV